MSQLQPSTLIPLCPLDKLTPGIGRTFDIQGRCVALFLTDDGKVFATDNNCPHRDGPLSDGMLSGDSVICPLHSYSFDFATGKCDQPGTDAVQTYPIEIRDNQVFIQLPP